MYIDVKLIRAMEDARLALGRLYGAYMSAAEKACVCGDTKSSEYYVKQANEVMLPVEKGIIHDLVAMEKEES